MPTPPPWWMETHVAPPAVLKSAFKSGQSETASDPSRIASVSRFGLATLPVPRWSRPMTIGAFTLPIATISLNASPAKCRPSAPDSPQLGERQKTGSEQKRRHAGHAGKMRES